MSLENNHTMENHNIAPAANCENDEIIASLNPEQRRAVLTTEGPVLVLAGAGSGKTRVITHRVAWLVERCAVHPAEILAITFTNKAANEMKERISQMIGPAARGAWIGTFHSMMLRILRRHADLLGYRPQFAIFDIADQDVVMREVLQEFNLKADSPANMRRIISSFKNKAWSVKDVRNNKSIFRNDKMADIYKAYQKSLFERNAMDFDDILLQTLRLFREHEEVLKRYQSQFRYILVDEYQDTNLVQYELVHLLSAKHKNICVVGDDDQSIYSFRGADIRNILDFEHDFPHCETIRLEQNYRSTSVILDAANSIISDNEQRKDKRLWTDKKGGAPIILYGAEDHLDEARFVASDIKRRLAQEDRDEDLSIAILYRMNALSRNFEYYLRNEAIDYKIYGGTRFYDRKEIKDIIAYLRLIMTDEDDVSFRRAVQSPRRGIGDVTIERIRELAEKESCSMLEIARRADSYEKLSHTAARVKSFARLIDNMRAELFDSDKEDVSLPDFIEHVQLSSGIVNHLKKEAKQGKVDAVSRLENLQELLSSALDFEAQILREKEYGEFSDPFYEEDEQIDDLAQLMEKFLERTALYSDQDEDSEDAAVSLMTVHSAKGLEFDVVYLVAMEQNVFPASQAVGERERMEEERRLAYVAVTRARKELIISTARNRLLFGRTQYNLPSCFLEPIPEELVERRGNHQPSAGTSYFDLSNRSSSMSPTFRRKRQFRPANRQNYARSNQDKIEQSSEEASGIDPKEIHPGDKIRHKSFGLGTIKKVSPVGKDAILVIDFSGSIKRFMASQSFLTLE